MVALILTFLIFTTALVHAEPPSKTFDMKPWEAPMLNPILRKHCGDQKDQTDYQECRQRFSEYVATCKGRLKEVARWASAYPRGDYAGALRDCVGDAFEKAVRQK